MAPHNLMGAVSRVKLMNALGGRGSLGSGGSSESPTIKCCIRVRPFIQEEISGSRSEGQTKLCIAMPTQTHVEITNDEDEKRTFEYDRTYWSFDKVHPLAASQETLQTELGEQMITQALNGFNNCIFAYGQTGSGKSFSVLGGEGDARGLLPRIVEGFFDRIGTLPPQTTVKTTVAILEIYNEQLRDLLATETGDGKRAKLDVKQHPVLGTIVPGLTEAPVASSQAVLQLVEYGVKMRMVSATAMNATSSRSHCIFTVKNNLSESGQARVSQTHLVDLAGSERAKRTGVQGDRLKEGAAINQSLSTLARVISELAKGGKGHRPPFRDSKLTFLLKESLCGNSKTIMMAAISPNLLDYEETLSTLKFAESVKKVQTSAVVNQVNEKGIEAKLRRELEELKAELAKRTTSPDDAKVNYLEQRVREQEQLCALWGQDWDTFRNHEQKKAIARASMTPEKLQELMKQFSNDKLDALSERETDANSDVGMEPHVCLLRIEAAASIVAAVGPGRDAAVLLPSTADPNELMLVGPRANTLLDDSEALNKFNQNTDTLSEKSQALLFELEKAQDVLDEFAIPGAPIWCLKAQALVDILDPTEISLVVKAWTEPWPGDDTATSFTKEEEVVTVEQFRKRMEWVQGQVSDGETAKHSDLWRASGPHHAQDVQAAARAVSKQQEIEDLKARLASLGEEVAKLRLQSGQNKVESPMGAENEDVLKALAKVPPGKALDQIRQHSADSKSLMEMIRANFKSAIQGVAGPTETLQRQEELIKAAMAAGGEKAKPAKSPLKRTSSNLSSGGSPRSMIKPSAHPAVVAAAAHDAAAARVIRTRSEAVVGGNHAATVDEDDDAEKGPAQSPVAASSASAPTPAPAPAPAASPPAALPPTAAAEAADEDEDEYL